MILEGVAWIQDRVGDAGKGGVNTVDDGDADGFTNTVTIASGSFDTGDIDITKDKLAWDEPNNPSPTGYLRDPALGFGDERSSVGGGEANTAAPAESRIVSVTATTITVEDDIIPDNLSGADWEVRRPAPASASPGGGVAEGSNPDGFGYCRYTGYLSQQPTNESTGRRFRITRKAIARLEP